ncbi:MAG: hypothetical protein ACKVRN_00105 [Pyrinomonadaceae bacterium]
MHGIPKELNLEDIVGSSIGEICLDRFNIRIHFEAGVIISIEGKITIKENGSAIATWDQADNWSGVGFQRIFSFPVTHYCVVNEHLLEIEFANNVVLQLHDDTDQYESFNISRKDSDEIIVV